MPKGVYQRETWMGNYGKTTPVRAEVLRLLEEGNSHRKVGKMLGVSRTTVYHIKNGTWGNEGRKKK